MTKRLSMGLLVGVLGLGAGCGSNGDPNSCVTADGWICNPSGVPFVQVAADISDLCGGPVAKCDLAKNQPPGTTTATLTQPASGKLCLSGTVALGGWANLLLAYSVIDKEGNVVKKFDADTLGITQAAFTIDSPPSGGITVDAAVTGSLACAPGEICFTYGFRLMTTPTSMVPVSITSPGPQVAPFVNFQQTDASMSPTFDTSGLEHIDLGVGAGDYDFCLHDFKFLDAAGNEVMAVTS